METLLRAGLSNALAATLMAIVATGLSRPLARCPAILHGLWLLVLIKLVTPPIYELPIPWPMSPTAPTRLPFEVTPLDVVAVTDVDVPDDHPDADGGCLGIVAGCEKSPDGASPARREGDPGASILGVPVSDACRWTGCAWLAGALVVLLLSFHRIRRFQLLLMEAAAAHGSSKTGSTSGPGDWGSGGLPIYGGSLGRSRP